jgi:hypothetical protein
LPKGTYKGTIPVDFAGCANNLEEFRKMNMDCGLFKMSSAEDIL